jgi:hypothetical protein
LNLKRPAAPAFFHIGDFSQAGFLGPAAPAFFRINDFSFGD